MTYIQASELRRAYGQKCPYCRLPMVGPKRPSRDHVYPKSRGGRLSGSNKIIVCLPCNHDKDSMTLEQFYFWLKERGDVRARHVALVVHLMESPKSAIRTDPSPPAEWADEQSIRNAFATAGHVDAVASEAGAQ